MAEGTRLVTEQNGKKMAQIMFFNGLSRTTSTGDIAYLKNPYIEDNLAFSFQLEAAIPARISEMLRKRRGCVFSGTGSCRGRSRSPTADPQK